MGHGKSRFSMLNLFIFIFLATCMNFGIAGPSKLTKLFINCRKIMAATVLLFNLQMRNIGMNLSLSLLWYVFFQLVQTRLFCNCNAMWLFST